jgi:hypothetical protein
MRKIRAPQVFRLAPGGTPTGMTGHARCALRWLCLASGLAASAASAANDADIYALIDGLKPVAEAIVVDGNPSDWGAIPAFPDPSGDAGGDPSRDITSVRIAPTANALYVLIQSAAAPSTADWAFWIQIDFMGEQFDDVEIAINNSGDDALSYAPEDGCPGNCSMAWEHATVAIGSAVEVRIPYAELDAVLPPAMQGKLTGSGARPFLRVRPRTVDYPPPNYFYTEIDDGASVGSYRLVTTPYSLDAALPAGGSPFTAVPDPLPGLWYVGQGSFTHGSHSGIWGYDLNRVDNALHIESPVGSTNLGDNLSFSQPIHAPVAGTVYSVASANPDQPIGQYGNPIDANFLFLQIPGNIGLLFTHMKQASIPFAQGNAVAAGAFLGRVGNSGYSGWPHLHFGGDTIPAQPGGVGIPLGITSANVGLNPTLSDPWRRTVASWGIREGYFVLPEPDARAALVLGIALIAALAQLRRVRALRHARAPRGARSPRPDRAQSPVRAGTSRRTFPPRGSSARASR